MSNVQEDSSTALLQHFRGTNYSKALIDKCSRAIENSTQNPKKAMKIANELCSAYNEEYIVHFVRAQVIANQAFSLSKNNRKKHELFKEALDCVQRANFLKSDSIVLAQVTAEILYELANDPGEYDRVIEVCKNALNMDVPNNHYYKEMKKDIRKLMKNAKAGNQLKCNRDDNDEEIIAIDKSVARTQEEIIECDYEQELQAIEELVSQEDKKRNAEFVKKTGEYWRKLSTEDKGKILDAKVAEAEDYFGGKEDDNSLMAFKLLKDAVQWYKEKGHWVTWFCCICKKDGYEDWISIEKHIDKMHFGSADPKVEGSCDRYPVEVHFDIVEIDDGGCFILDKEMLVEHLADDLYANKRFLLEWLRKDYNIEARIKSWENRKVARGKIGQNIFALIVKVMQEAESSAEAGNKNAKISSLKQALVQMSAYDYREIIVPYIKSFIQARLESLVDEASKKADLAMAELLEELSIEDGSMPTRTKKSKKKKGIKKNLLPAAKTPSDTK